MCACLEVCEENKTVFNGGVAPKASGGGKSTCHKRVVDSCKVRACWSSVLMDRVCPPPPAFCAFCKRGFVGRQRAGSRFGRSKLILIALAVAVQVVHFPSEFLGTRIEGVRRSNMDASFRSAAVAQRGHRTYALPKIVRRGDFVSQSRCPLCKFGSLSAAGE